LCVTAECGVVNPIESTSNIEQAGQPGERMGEAVPRWLFGVRSAAGQALVAATAATLLVISALAVEDLGRYRPGPLFVLVVVGVATLAGWQAAAVTGAVAWLAFWWGVVAPARSLHLDSTADALAVASMAGVVLGLVALCRRLQRAVVDVRSLDASYRRAVAHQRGARALAERSAADMRSVVQLSTALAAQEGVREVAQTAIDQLVLPAKASSAAVAILRDGTLDVLAAVGVDADSLRKIDRGQLEGSSWLRQVRAGLPVFVDDRAEFERLYPNAKVLELYPSHSWAVVPFRSGETVGVLSLHFDEAQPLSAHSAYLNLCAEILAVALHRAEAFERQSAERADLQAAFAERDRIARTLSTTLLPPRLPRLPGYEIDAWLLPSSADEVAGDFYDVLAVPGGGWVAVLGDVCGKGAEAAAVTALARYAARVAALEDPDPAHIAKVANDALLVDPSDLYCTMVIVHCPAPPSDQLQVALAGHPQPRLVRGREVVRLGQYAAPLGLFDGTVHVEEHAFEPGDMLVLYSDGLIERDDRLDEDALDRRLANLADRRASAVARELQSVLLSLPARHLDDVAVLAISRSGTPRHAAKPRLTQASRSATSGHQ
jgi:serine phosphatase RsbU (regulator of sigma subunit)